MRKVLFGIVLLVSLNFSFILSAFPNHLKNNSFCELSRKIQIEKSTKTPIDSAQILSFYAKYPKLILYKNQVEELYQKNDFHYIWFDQKGKKEIAEVLYNKINNLAEEGVLVSVPYKNEWETLYLNEASNISIEEELFLSTYYMRKKIISINRERTFHELV